MHKTLPMLLGGDEIIKFYAPLFKTINELVNAILQT